MNNADFNNLTKGCWYGRLFKYLQLAGIEKVIFEYSGGGDSGGVDNVTTTPVEKTYIAQELLDSMDSIQDPIYNRHGSFADGGGYYVSGQLEYNATEKSVVLRGTDHHTEYLYDNEDSPDCDTNEWSEDWEELIYNHSVDSESSESLSEEFDFAYFYALNVVKGRLPEEFHNRMLAEAASNDNKWCKLYIKFLGK